MHKGIRLFILASLLFCFSTAAFASGIGRGVDSFTSSLPEPRLLSPISEKVVLTGKDSLTFQWMWDYPSLITSYDFRLYKGYNTVKDSLIYKENLDSDQRSINIAADKFQDGQVYTWTLRQIANSGRKSELASSSFKVTK